MALLASRAMASRAIASRPSVHYGTLAMALLTTLWLYLLLYGSTYYSVALLTTLWLYLQLCGSTYYSMALLTTLWLYLLLYGSTYYSMALLTTLWLYLLWRTAVRCRAMIHGQGILTLTLLLTMAHSSTMSCESRLLCVSGNRPG